MSEIRNGVDVDKLEEMINAMRADPVKAQVKFQAETKWINCAYSETKIRNFTLEGDEPISLLGSNRVPNHVETILAALGSCLSIGFAYNAATEELT
jgi:uncharacterized OsmC-like protein